MTIETLGQYITTVADTLCGYPLFVLLIGGGLALFVYSGMVSLRRLPEAVRILRRRGGDGDSSAGGRDGQISSVQALASVVAATVGMGNIAGVAIALVMGGPGAIFWMWISALVGMTTKYHEGVLAIKYRGTDPDGRPQGGPMHVITGGLGRRWRWLATFFAVAGMFGTLCIMNANQLTEAMVTLFSTPEGIASSPLLGHVAWLTGLDRLHSLRLLMGLGIATVVAVVVIGGIKRIASVASVLVPFMVGLYFLIVLYIIVTNLDAVPGVLASIVTEAFNWRAGFGALAGIALIGARRAMLVNDAGVGTATLMHGASRNTSPVREGLVAMLGPAIDSGLVCTLTAVAILIGCDLGEVDGMKGLAVAMTAFGRVVPAGAWLLMFIVMCFALSSMFSYSFYGHTCATYLFGARKARWYTYFFIATLVAFAVIPVGAAVGLCDLFYALMAFPTMLAVLRLAPQVKAETRRYFSSRVKNETSQSTQNDPGRETQARGEGSGDAPYCL